MASGKDLLTPESRIVALHVGDSGSGKTCAAGTYPGPVYIFDIDRRIAGLKGYTPTYERLEKGDIDYDNFPMTAEGLEKMETQCEKFIREGWKMRYKTIIIDTVTSFDKMALAYAKKWVSNPAKTFGKYTTEGFDEWNVELKIFDKLLTNIVPTLPCNVIVGAHWANEYESPEPGKPATIVVGKKINLRPKIAEVVPTYFNEVFFFETKMERQQNPATRQMEDVKKHYCVTRNELARTTYRELPNRFDWTGKDFFSILTSHMSEEAQKKLAEGMSQITS